jgi:hypothetical protein
MPRDEKMSSLLLFWIPRAGLHKEINKVRYLYTFGLEKLVKKGDSLRLIRI